MVERLYFNKKIEVRKSPIHGYGVFAKEDINKGEILEECFYIVQDFNPYNADYLFSFPDKNNENKYNVLPLGYGCIYNSSKVEGENNAIWNTNIDDNIFIFKSIKDIKKDEEICTFYGKNWWENYNKKYLPENIK